jgi:cellobiose epimerase
MMKWKGTAMNDGMGVQWGDGVRRELVDNILPFWMNHAVDLENGGFYGKIADDMTIDTEAPRSAVLNTRILWTFSAASRLLGDAYLSTADRAFDYVANKFRDPQYGGLFWMLDNRGAMVSDRKQIYAQAFGIYALAEYYRATKRTESLVLAQQIFRLIEQHSCDGELAGYWEARARDWSPLADMRLSEKDLNSPKSMNTHLHIMEAYTNLLRVWRDPALVARQADLLRIMLDRIFDMRTGHMRLFFDRQWHSLTSGVSYGHDIEANWLLVEAAEVLGDADLLERARGVALILAQNVYRQGLDKDGSLFYEADGRGTLTDANKHWWAQAEAVVGFYNAYQMSGDRKFATAAQRVWAYIEEKVVDRRSGEWHAKLSPQGVPLSANVDGDVCLAGPWKCPYHNSRACFEMLERIKRPAVE